MDKYARVARAGTPGILAVDRPFSNFAFVENHFGDVWPLRRILSQARQHGAKTMVLEGVGGAEDLREENDELRKVCPLYNASKSRAFRLSFFTKSFATTRGLSALEEQDFLGFAIVKADDIPRTPGVERSGERLVRVFESVLRPSRHDNNFIRGARTWACQVAGSVFNVKGYIYAQQTGVSDSCAHVALRTVAGRFSEANVSSSQISRWVRQFRREANRYDSPMRQGLNIQDIRAVLRCVGCRDDFLGDFTLATSHFVPFQKYIYGSIESGFPAILFFATTDPLPAPSNPPPCHVIPVIGHTFNEDVWVPKADFSYFRVGAGTTYMPSEAWVSMYLAHDDNYGSNYCVPRHYLYTLPLCREMAGGPALCKQEAQCVAYAIGTLPNTIQVSPIQAEVIAADYLLKILEKMPAFSGKWGQRLRDYAALNMIVLRPILIDGVDYADHLGTATDWGGQHFPPVDITAFKPVSDRKFWMIEISVPELFSANKRKLGELLLDAGAKPTAQRDFATFVFARLPGYFVFFRGGDSSKPQYDFLRSAFTDHIELFGCKE